MLPAQAGALTFSKPAGWIDRAAASSMRVAEFVVPKAAGDSEDGELIVYYFGGTGGTVEANLQRWTTQFQSTRRSGADDGKGQRAAADESRCQRHVCRRSSPGCDRAPQQARLPHARDRVVETPKGPYFIKLTGPAATIDGASAAFDQFLKSLAFK